MNAVARSDKARWAVSAVAAGGLMAGLFWLLGHPLALSLAPMPAGPKASVVLIRPGTATLALSEQAILRDTAPLFLPTERDAAVLELPRREPARAFLDSDSLRLNFGDAPLNLTEALPPSMLLNGKSAARARSEDALAAESGIPPLAGFGRMESRITPAPARGGFVEIVASSTGQQVLAEALPPAAAPPGGKEWQPMEFLAVVDPAGLVGLKLTEGSRVEEVDAYFRNFLSQQLRIGARLAPGFYRVIVGP